MKALKLSSNFNMAKRNFLTWQITEPLITSKALLDLMNWLVIHTVEKSINLVTNNFDVVIFLILKRTFYYWVSFL